MRVQCSRHHCHRADEGKVRQHQSRGVDADLKRRLGRQARRQTCDRIRRRDTEQQGRGENDQPDSAERAPCKGRRRGIVRSALDAQIRRHQHGVERALAQQPPRDVDELECEQEHVGDAAGAEQRRDQGIAHKS